MNKSQKKIQFRRSISAMALATVLLTCLPGQLRAQIANDFSARQESRRSEAARQQTVMENYDIRYDSSTEARATIDDLRRRQSASQNRASSLGSERQQTMARAEANLAARVPGLVVERDEVLSVPEIVGVDTSSTRFLTAPSNDSGEVVLRRFINANRALYGLTASQVAELKVTENYTNPAGNLSWVALRQEIDGIPVFRGELRAALTRRGELVRTTGQLAPDLDYRRLAASSGAMRPADAVARAAASIGVTVSAESLSLKSSSPDERTFVFEPGLFAGETKVEVQYFPLESGIAVLAYSMVLWQDVSAYYILVDAETGQLLFRKNITENQTEPATYVIYDDRNPAPLTPSTAFPGTGLQGLGIPRVALTRISELPLFDNLGWMTDGTNITTGNNVDSGLDLVTPNGIDPGSRAVGSPYRVFDFDYNPPPQGTDDPMNPNWRLGMVTSMFFWTNRYHDRLYELGFTEAARNFQTNNFGRGGLGNDHVLAEGQDYSGTNNANFATPPDGSSGRMQMYRFTGPNPDRDSGLDQEILIHELTHGTSNRLHSNASGLSANMSRGMGEGWSDFYGHALLSDPSEDPNGIYATGGWATLQFASFTTYFDNFYYGIRRFPYAVRSNVGPGGRPHNPLTFADIDASKIDLTDGAYPRGPIGSSSAHAVHNIGEVWCSALWEVRARFIARLGFDEGNRRILQLVTDGMKLDPVNPTLLAGRDSILAAAQAAFGGEDVNDIWAGFATRGMGFGATVTAASITPITVTESFQVPPGTIPLRATLARGAGNDIVATITLTNTTTAPVENAVMTLARASTVDGLSFVDGQPVPQFLGATVAPGASVTVTVTFPGTASVPSGFNGRLRVDGTITGGIFSYTESITAP